MNEIYPVKMSGNFYLDPRLEDFCRYIGETAWSILLSQGYNVENLMTKFTEMWVQEHHKHSLMEQHVHGLGAQIVGVYFLETPENCSKLIFHDPKAAKVQIGLPEIDQNTISTESNMVSFNQELVKTSNPSSGLKLTILLAVDIVFWSISGKPI